MITCERTLIVQSIQLRHYDIAKPQKDIVEVYLYGKAPDFKEGGYEVVESVDKIELRFKAPRYMVEGLKSGDKVTLTLK